MSGKSFKQGYACSKCQKEDGRGAVHCNPLYLRENGKFVFLKLVKCPYHGIVEAIALKVL